MKVFHGLEWILFLVGVPPPAPVVLGPDISDHRVYTCILHMERKHHIFSVNLAKKKAVYVYLYSMHENSMCSVKNLVELAAILDPAVVSSPHIATVCFHG